MVKETTETTEITLDEILVLRDKMKTLSSRWAIKLGKIMFPELEEAVARERVYNITSGSTRNNDARMDFINGANDLIAQLQKNTTQARKQLQKLTK